jgi:tetratricopeptide (TPR) repeat protein
MHAGVQERQAFIDQAMRQGYILTAYFAGMLPEYEKSQYAFRLFYPKLIESINVKKEEKRLKKVEFAKSAPERVVAPPAPVQIDPVEKALASAEGMFQQHNLQKSAKTFRQVLRQTQKPEFVARAQYGLGLIALEEKRWDDAVQQFQLTLAKSPQSREGAWSHYYLGQLDLKSGNPDKAMEESKLTLATEGVSAKAREAAAYALKHNSSASVGEKEP